MHQDKSRYLKLMKKLTKGVIKQKFEKAGEDIWEDKLADLRLEMHKMKVEIIAKFKEKLSEQRTQDIKRMTIDTK